MTKNIEYLLEKYSPYHLSNGEVVSPEYKAKIKRNGYRLKREYKVKEIGRQYGFSKFTIEKTVWLINHIDNLKDLCNNYTLEKIIVALGLFCMIENCKEVPFRNIWIEYDLTWREYALIVSRVLSFYRFNMEVV